MRSPDLIRTAERLLHCKGKPKQADLRRAVSTLYYAMFHELARACADHLAGTEGANRSDGAWHQAYRALDHFHVKQQCDNRYLKKEENKFPQDIRGFASFLVEMQRKRHEADYDPYANYTKSEVTADIESTKEAIETYRSVPTRDRKAFSVYILLKSRAVNTKKPSPPS